MEAMELLGPEDIERIERDHAGGLPVRAILEIFRPRGVQLSEATFRKYVQAGLLPRSRRVGRKGKHQGSRGLYPVEAVRRINAIKKMMAEGHTLEDIKRSFLFHRNHIDQLERDLASVLDGFQSELGGRPFGGDHRRTLEEAAGRPEAAGAGLGSGCGTSGQRRHRARRRNAQFAIGCYRPGQPDRLGTFGGDMSEVKQLQEGEEESGEGVEEGQTAERRRSKTMSRKEMARDLRRRRLTGQVDPEEGELLKTIDSQRPRTRADCVNGPRPCLFVSCKHNLYLDVNPETGSIKLNFPDKEIQELEHTCALDVAEKGGITLEEVGEIMNLTRERIRQVETRGLMKLREATEAEPPVSARKP